jgi:hypothetical protein
VEVIRGYTSRVYLEHEWLACVVFYGLYTVWGTLGFALWRVAMAIGLPNLVIISLPPVGNEADRVAAAGV